MYLLAHFRFFLVALILISLTITNCTNEIKKPNSPKIEPISFLALGDSYSIGTAIEEPQNWPNQLSNKLRDYNVTVQKTQVVAKNGWTTTDLKNGIANASPDSTFDLVSLLIGVNNQYQGLDVELYKTEFRELLEQSIAFARGDTSRVFVVSIPNYGVTPFARNRNPEVIGKEVALYNSIAKKISREFDIPFINITLISEEAEDDDSLLASDELHPSAKMYAMWVEEMMPTITKILKE